MGCSSSKSGRPIDLIVEGEPVETTLQTFGAAPHGSPPPPLDGTVDLITPTGKRYAKHHCNVEDGELSYRLCNKRETLVLAVNEVACLKGSNQRREQAELVAIQT